MVVLVSGNCFSQLYCEKINYIPLALLNLFVVIYLKPLYLLGAICYSGAAELKAMVSVSTAVVVSEIEREVVLVTKSMKVNWMW